MLSEFDKNIDTDIKDYEGSEGDHLVLECKSLNSYPTPTITWVMTSSITDTESTPVMEDDRVFLDHLGEFCQTLQVSKKYIVYRRKKHSGLIKSKVITNYVIIQMSNEGIVSYNNIYTI